MKRQDFEIEVCSNSVLSSIEADKGGANRVELCDNLYEGGTTPSIGTILQTKEQTNIDIFPIIRPRGGDFCYSENEIYSMIKDIEISREYGADGFAIGCLTVDGKIDHDNTARLIEAGKGLPFTFHRAFDLCKNPFEAMDILENLGIKRILSSGQHNKAIDGVELLSQMQNYSKQIRIMVGSGVDENNITEIAAVTKVKSFHISLRTWQDSPMKFRREGIYMGGLKDIPEYANAYSDNTRIKHLIDNLINL